MFCETLLGHEYVLFDVSLSLSHTHTHTHTRARARARPFVLKSCDDCNWKRESNTTIDGVWTGIQIY
jgi:hypothetical protein